MNGRPGSGSARRAPNDRIWVFAATISIGVRSKICRGASVSAFAQPTGISLIDQARTALKGEVPPYPLYHHERASLEPD